MQIINNGQSIIINDSYNANPDSFHPALDTLTFLAKEENKRKILVIGDMLELGKRSDELHRALFMKLLHYDVDAIFTYGLACRKAIKHIKENGYTKAFSFDSHEELAKKLKQFLKPGDVILLKGSRGMHMEKVLAHL
jgi:UDP-N-acetylmuramyl pentapeptide synthase